MVKAGEGNMKRTILASSVQGANHIRVDKPNQDSYKIVEFHTVDGQPITIISVADGHGSDKCPYSATGSKVAVNAFCSIMQGLVESYAIEMEQLFILLNHEGNTRIASIIDREWKSRIKNNHSKNKREWPVDKDCNTDYQAVYRLYGTTLLGLVITSEFIFSLQIGDGDIIYVDASSVANVIEGDKILGTETHSLSKLDAWRKSYTVTRRTADLEEPYMYLLSTDGFANSHKSEEEFFKSCQDYFTMIVENGPKVIQEHLTDWLAETSELGCGDDITVVMAYHGEEMEK